MPQLQVLSKIDLSKETVAEIGSGASDPLAFEDALAKMRSGEDYTFYTQLFRGLRQSALSAGCFLYRRTRETALSRWSASAQGYSNRAKSTKRDSSSIL